MMLNEISAGKYHINLISDVKSPTTVNEKKSYGKVFTLTSNKNCFFKRHNSTFVHTTLSRTIEFSCSHDI